jgi:NTP pyrophosphatase (non-canonical NTP hydrolase)
VLNSRSEKEDDMNDKMTIGEWQKAAYAQSARSGFHDGPPVFSEFTANMHSEASEMWEAYRKGQLNAPCDKADRMTEPLTCLEEELADIVIRALDTAETFGVDLARAMRVKHAFNGTRPRKHGGKLA